MCPKILLFLCIFCTLCFKSRLHSQVVISEVLASNTHTNIANYTKNYVDWIELYNKGENNVDIGGWFLSDDILKPSKWKIPNFISIKAKKHEIFWADNMNILDHISFRLNKEGESVYLFDSDTLLIDSIRYAGLEPDISYGILSDTSNQRVYFSEVTPKSTNSFFGSKELCFVSANKFSLEAGFYDKPLLLELSAEQKSSKIYYTIDGSVPTRKSILYSKPILIEKTTVIRSRVFAPELLASKIKTSTYFIRENSKLPVISLSTDSENLWSREFGIYIPGPNHIPDDWESANYFKSWKRPVNVEFFGSDGTLGFNVSAGMKIHGRSTRNNAQKTLAIFLGKKYGSSELQHKIFANRDSVGCNSFLLRNSGNDWGVTMFKDALVHTLVDGEIDIDAQAYQPSIVYINGKYWGIHNIREKINPDYLGNKYDIDYKKIDIIEIDGLKTKPEALHGNLKEYNNLVKFMEGNNLRQNENYSEVNKSIDIDECINYHIIQTIIANGDFPGSNVKYWKERKMNTKWRWILYDTEFSFGFGGAYYKAKAINRLLEPNSTEVYNRPWANYLIRKLFDNEGFKDEFVQRTAVYLNTVFSEKRVNEVIDSLKKNIEPEIKKHFAKWGGIEQKASPFLITSKNIMEWENNIEYIKGFIAHRAGFVRKNFMKQFALKDTVSFEIKMNNNRAGKIALMGYSLPDSKFKGQVFADIPIRIEAIPNEGYEFVKWKEDDLERNCTLIPTKDKKLTAIFKKNKPPLN